MEEQKKIVDKGATMRLGSLRPATLTPGTLGAQGLRRRQRAASATATATR